MTRVNVLEPNDALKAAQAHLEAGQPGEAVALLEQVLEDDPDNADALYLSAVIAYFNRFVPQAIELFEQALEVRPDFADAHLMLGNVLTAEKRFDEAIIHWRRALVLKPGNAAAHANIARILGERGQYGAAAESARRAFFNPQCRPLHLPAEKYAIWKDLVVDFSPKDIL